ncbi:MAG: B12-binding domain-containing radical SAM protein [Deltaproteobacteria bacterium]|nr:B12-binding domain-containing radical SAM protein [Deltaproteobacteria bacterium]
MANVLMLKVGGGPPFQITPPLGALTLAAVARAHGHDCRFADLRLTRPEKAVPRLVEEFSPHVVGISAMYSEAGAVERAAALVKKASGGKARVVVGGPYPTTAPERSLSHPGVDLAVVGEAERTFPLVLDLLENPSPGNPDDIPGVAFRHGNDVRLNPGPKPLEDLDSLPYPAWDLADFQRYRRAPRVAMLRPRRYAVIMTSRGCPYKCIFCHKTMGTRFRPMSPARVADEMEHVVGRFGVEEFEVWDDVFNLDEQRAAAVCDLILERGLKVKLAFPANLRADRMTVPLMEKMRAAGLYFMGVSFETGSPRWQKKIDKHFDVDRAWETVETAGKLGITTLGFFILGFPGETAEEMEQTIDLACRSSLNFATFYTLRPFPKTPLWRMCQQAGYRLRPEQSMYVSTAHNLSAVEDRRYARIVRSAYRRFYAAAPRRIFLSGAFRDVCLSTALKEFLLRQTPLR